QDPAPALADLQADLTRCFAAAAEDAMCRTLAAQAEWVEQERLVKEGKSPVAILESALAKAVLASRSPEPFPDAWYTVAETHLRLARLESSPRKARNLHIDEGLSALEKAFAINPNHALGLATQGALQLLRAEEERDTAARRTAAQAAAQALERAL